MFSEERNVEDVTGSGRGLFDVIFRNFFAWSKQNYDASVKVSCIQGPQNPDLNKVTELFLSTT
jgi:hypothetical protein